MRHYLVKPHDTLWKIARKKSTTVEAIASLNKLKGRQIHSLKVDQVLYLPDESNGQPDTKVTLHFRGLDFKSITPKKVKAAYDGRDHFYDLPSNQNVLLFIQDHTRGLKAWIEGPDKTMELVLEREVLPLGNWNVNIDSRRTKTDGSLQPKKGTQGSSTTNIKDGTTHNAQVTNGNTAVEQARVEGGQPVQAIATIYTGNNLRLSAGNEKYRQHLISAAERHGLTPQSLAALVDAEAGKIEGVWDENSNKGHPKRAQGLAQFFPAAWTDVFNYSKSLLHQDCQKLSESARLNKRYEAKYAIDSAASYAILNLRNFGKLTKYDVKSLSSEDKAKLAYFLHHEGVGGALWFVGKAVPPTKKEAREKLLGQLNDDEKRVEKIIEQYDGNSVDAYKGWLFAYVDSKINISNFIVKDQQSFAVAAKSCRDILASLSPISAAPASQSKPKPSSKPSPPPSPPAKTEGQTAKAKPEAAKPANTEAQKPPAQTEASKPAAAVAAVGNANGHWHDPLDVCTLRTAGLSGKVGATFGMVRVNGTKAHQGLDLIAVPGTPIYAVADGTVHTAKAKNPKYAYGDTLILEVSINDLPPAQAEYFLKINPNRKTIGFFYAHLSDMPKEKTSVVVAGQIIGKTGDSGNAEGMTTVEKGAHLHFEVRLDAMKLATGLNNRANPLPFIQNCTNR